MGTGWEQRLAQIDAELAELGEPTEGTETLRARIAALSRGDPGELDRELEHMERLTRAASRRSFGERASEGAASAGASSMEGEAAEASPVTPSEAGKGAASEAAPSWAQALFDEAESAEDDEEELDLELGSEPARDARGGAEPSDRDTATDDSDGLAALLEGDEENGPNEARGDAPQSSKAVAAEPDTTKEPVPSSVEPDTTKQPAPPSADAEAVYADADNDEDEDYAEIDTGEVEVLVDDVIVEEDESGLNQGSEL